MPLLCGKQLSQNTALYTISMISWFGYFVNDSVFIVTSTLYFIIVLMYLSTSIMSGDMKHNIC